MILPREIWKDVLGFEGAYQVSNIGNVRNKKSGRKLNPSKASTGYMMVDLRIGEINKRKNATVHRLVMESFLGYKPLDVNHIDGNKGNNMITNLEYCTREYNLKHALKTGLRKPRKTTIIIGKDINTGIEYIFDSYENVYKFLNIKKTTSIWRAIKTGKVYKNMVWERGIE